jgi:Rad3-related DNA helicase
MRAAPIYVGDHLAGAIYESNRTVVFTSATLTVDREFHYLRQRLGLHSQEDRLAELTVPSPFDHQDQLLLCIPTDMPLPGEQGYLESLCAAVADIAECAGGGTLVLFTAYSTMMAAHELLLPRIQEMSLELLCQQLSGERTQLLEELRRDRGTVLLGVKSFWEGVDVPGEALRCLVMAKLPFAVPSDPVIEARCEHLESQDIDSRTTYYIPQAILGFRQGLGRLVRTRRDRGVAFVLDRRLLTRAYGRRFLDSIEGCTLVCKPLPTCLDRAADWLARRFSSRRDEREHSDG